MDQMDRAGGLTSQHNATTEATFMNTLQNRANSIEDRLIEIKNRLVEAGFHVRQGVENNTKLEVAIPNDTAKDIINNTINRIYQLVDDINGQIRQVC